MDNKTIPQVDEFFATYNELFSGNWDKELFQKLCDEYSALTNSKELWQIAFSAVEGKYSLEERLAAFERYHDITGIDKTDRLYSELRAVVINMAANFKGQPDK